MTHSQEQHHRERAAGKLAGRREQRMEAGETDPRNNTEEPTYRIIITAMRDQ